MKTNKLRGPGLDWAVAKCEGHEVEMWHTYVYLGMPNERIVGKGVSIGERDGFGQIGYEPSTNWAQGGPIIERERIMLSPLHESSEWSALSGCRTKGAKGPTPLIAAMRCYVASKLGDEVDVPEELK